MLNAPVFPFLCKELESTSPQHSFTDAEDVMAQCNDLYQGGKITVCGDILKEALRNGMTKKDIIEAAEIFGYSNQEMNCGMTRCVHDYLPSELRSDLYTLLETYRGLKKIAGLCATSPSNETLQILQK